MASDIMTAKKKLTDAESRIWYAPSSRIRTPAAAAHARRVVRSIRDGSASDGTWTEQDLFRAMHSCAYRATARRARKAASAETLVRWARRWAAVRDFIVETNLPLVYAMIGRFDTRGLDHDDVLSEAMFGLAQAVERFDPWRGFRFSTYACHAIHRAMIRSSKGSDRYRRLFPVQHDVTFERPDSEPSTTGLFVERLQRALDGNLGQLTKLESRILDKRFPTDIDRRRLTLQQVGEAVGLSKERVRQIQNQALTKLRSVLEADPALQ